MWRIHISHILNAQLQSTHSLPQSPINIFESSKSFPILQADSIYTKLGHLNLDWMSFRDFSHYFQKSLRLSPWDLLWYAFCFLVSSIENEILINCHEEISYITIITHIFYPLTLLISHQLNIHVSSSSFTILQADSIYSPNRTPKSWLNELSRLQSLFLEVIEVISLRSSMITRFVSWSHR